MSSTTSSTNQSSTKLHTTSTSSSSDTSTNSMFHIPCLSAIETYNTLNNISIPKLIIDLRSKDHFEVHRLRNAINLPMQTLWDEFLEKNEDMRQKYGSYNDNSDEMRQRRDAMTIEEKESFWRFVQEDPYKIMQKKSFDEFEYRGTVYKKALLYANSESELQHFIQLFRHNVSHLSQKEIEELHATDFVTISEDSLSTPSESNEYKSFSTTTALIYMKKNFKLKQLRTLPLREFENKFPFLFSTLKEKALEGEMPAMVNDFLFIGGYNHACNRDHLQALRINCILNMAAELDNKFEDVDFEDRTHKGSTWQISYKKLGIDDTVKDSVMHVLDEALEFIDNARKNNHRVLVHCAMGISRASAIVIAWLMMHHGWTFEVAKKYVKDCRSCVKPNPAFTQQLEGAFQERVLSKQK